jgi:hypothetical protein
MKTNLPKKLNLLQILEQENLFQTPNEETLISSFNLLYKLNQPETIEKYKQHRINHLKKFYTRQYKINTIDNNQTINNISTQTNIEKQVDNEFEKINNRVNLYIIH